MNEFQHWQVQEDEGQPSYNGKLHGGTKKTERRGAVGPYVYRALVRGNRSEANGLLGGTILQLMVTHRETGTVILDYDDVWLVKPESGNVELNFVINSIIFFYWNGIPRYAAGMTDAELSERRKRLTSYWSSLDSFVSGYYSDYLDTEKSITPAELSHLHVACEQFLKAAASIGHWPELWLKDTCEEIYEDVRDKERKEADHDV